MTRNSKFDGSIPTDPQSTDSQSTDRQSTDRQSIQADSGEANSSQANSSQANSSQANSSQANSSQANSSETEDDFAELLSTTMKARAQSLDVRRPSAPILDRPRSFRDGRPRLAYLVATAASVAALVLVSFALAGRAEGPVIELAADATSLDAVLHATIEPSSKATVIVWIDPEATKATINRIGNTLSESDALDSYRYISDAEVMHEFETYYRDFPDLLRVVNPDDIPTYFALTFRDSIPETEHKESAEQMVAQVGGVLKIQERPQGS